jgi:hypothetical protein
VEALVAWSIGTQLIPTLSIAHSIKVNKGEAKPEDFDNYGLPTIKNTIVTTAIIRAGRVSLDEKRSVVINVDSNGEYSLQ